MFVVSEAHLRYHAPARLDDALRITVQPDPPRGASIALAQQAWHGETLLVQSRITLACVDAGTLRPRRIPNPVLELITA